MNSRQIRALIVGACIGAAVGGFYGVVLVTYRDMLAARQAGVVPEKDCGCKDKEATVASSPELSDVERMPTGPVQGPTRSEIVRARARQMRADDPTLSWQEATHRAAAMNGAAHGVEETESGAA